MIQMTQTTKHDAFPLNVNSVIHLSPQSDRKSDGVDIKGILFRKEMEFM